MGAHHRPRATNCLMRWSLLVLLGGCAAVTSAPTATDTFGPEHAGSYHLGPVDFAESAFANACAPYPAEVQRLAGVHLAGVDRSLNGDGRLCDACALVTTRLGRTLVVRIITTGVAQAPGDLDLSPQAYEALHADDPTATPRDPRPMRWRLTRCPASGPMQLQFQAQANIDWTSFWVRNPRLPLERVEVQSARHATFTALRRGRDGSWNADRGFGPGRFTLRLTALDGATLTQAFDGFSPGALLPTALQFD